MFQATKAVKDDTEKLVGTINRMLGNTLSDEQSKTLFERMWPELEAKLKKVPVEGAAVAPQRTEKEMVAELLELARAESGTSTALFNALFKVVVEIRESVKPRMPSFASNLAAWSTENNFANLAVIAGLSGSPPPVEVRPSKDEGSKKK